MYDEPGAPPASHWPVSRLTALFSAATVLAAVLADLAARGEALPPHETFDVPEQDWVRATQAQFTPLRIADGLWIVPSWCDAGRSGRHQSRARSGTGVRDRVASEHAALPPLASTGIACRRDGSRFRMRLGNPGDRRRPVGRRPRRGYGHRSARAHGKPRERDAQRRRRDFPPGRRAFRDGSVRRRRRQHSRESAGVPRARALAPCATRWPHRPVGHPRCAGRRGHDGVRAVVYYRASASATKGGAALAGTRTGSAA